MIGSGKVWDHYSGKQESNRAAFDEKSRLLYSKTVDKHVYTSPYASNFIYENGFRPFYPDGKKFAVCVSHDIDYLFTSPFGIYPRLREVGKHILRGQWPKAARYVNPKMNPRYTIDDLLEIGKKYGIRSSYYFLALEEGEEDYNFDVRSISKLLAKIRESGNEIGLHGGHEAFCNKDVLNKEKERLENAAGISVTGYRNHFLRFHSTTWELLHDAGFTYDTTFGFPDFAGFRNAFCYPFFPSHAFGRNSGQLLELPLLAMDATFIYHLRWDEERTLRHVMGLIDQVRAVNGVMTILWHNTCLWSPWDKIYNEILKYCYAHDPWFATGEELIAWWRQNKFAEQYAKYGLTPDSAR